MARNSAAKEVAGKSNWDISDEVENPNKDDVFISVADKVLRNKSLSSSYRDRGSYGRNGYGSHGSDSYSRNRSSNGGRRGSGYDDRGSRYNGRGPGYDDRSSRYNGRGSRYDDRGSGYDDKRGDYRGFRYDDRRGSDRGSRYDDMRQERGNFRESSQPPSSMDL